MNSDDSNVIEVKYIDKPSLSDNTRNDRKITIGSKIKNMKKHHVDVLGNIYPAGKEILQTEIKL